MDCNMVIGQLMQLLHLIRLYPCSPNISGPDAVKPYPSLQSTRRKINFNSIFWFSIFGLIQKQYKYLSTFKLVLGAYCFSNSWSILCHAVSHRFAPYGPPLSVCLPWPSPFFFFFFFAGALMRLRCLLGSVLGWLGSPVSNLLLSLCLHSSVLQCTLYRLEFFCILFVSPFCLQFMLNSPSQELSPGLVQSLLLSFRAPVRSWTFFLPRGNFLVIFVPRINHLNLKACPWISCSTHNRRTDQHDSSRLGTTIAGYTRPTEVLWHYGIITSRRGFCVFQPPPVSLFCP